MSLKARDDGPQRTLDWWQSYLNGSRPLENARGTELVELLVGCLEAPIYSGEVKHGDRLPPERVLAAELGVSRATVREALHELELKGLVERRQGRGTVVTDVGRKELTQLLLRKLSAENRSVLEIMDFRDATEVPIAARAAKYATSADMSRLEIAVQRMESEIFGERYAELDTRFHQLVARATHNPLLVRLVELSSDWTHAIRSPVLEDTHRRRVSLEGHKAILKCIRERDAQGAAVAMQYHLRIVLSELTGKTVPPRRRSNLRNDR